MLPAGYTSSRVLATIGGRGSKAAPDARQEQMMGRGSQAAGHWSLAARVRHSLQTADVSSEIKASVLCVEAVSMLRTLY